MATTPQDVLPDGAEGVEFHGEYVRKGTVAAFIANAELLQSLPAGTPEYEDVVTIRNPAVATLLSDQPPGG